MPDESFPPREDGLSHTPPPPSIKVFQSSPHTGSSNNNNNHRTTTAAAAANNNNSNNNQMLLQSGLSYEGDLQTLLPPQRNRHRLSPRAAGQTPGTSSVVAKPQQQQPQQQQHQQPAQHRRTPSSSSNISLTSGYHNYSGYDQSSSKPLPTPEQTPVQASFLGQPQFASYDPSPSYRNAGDHTDMEMAMRRAVFEQQRQQQHQHRQQQAAHAVEEEATTFPSYTLPPSVSTLSHNSSATPQGHMNARANSPRDASPWTQQVSVFQNALHHPSHMNSSLRGMELMSHNGHEEQPKTISPKDAMLEFHESPADSSSMPLFPSQAEASQFEAAVATTLANTDFSNDAFAPFSSASQNTPQPYFLGQTAGADVLQYQTNTPQQQHQPPHQQHHSHPQHQQNSAEFAAALAGLDQAAGVDRKMQDHDSDLAAGRPDDTASEAGTYSCTYHGCTRRFETPARLQKHKREAHRQTTPGSHMLSRDSSTLGARGLSARNSQDGPHRCERTNPSTGKPCNSIFSRPYDLTRHEDTIHNARKQKVRCHLCTEEKTFSRNDALTRHMRVVHPNVTWPGKQKRRGRED
ncbi:hypothetical protein H106_05234 [Trichophyton rubrum CBS 735.88]|nr:hypothetical protein H106_05234 [Trichophyton rubrum CBS 735.88]